MLGDVSWLLPTRKQPCTTSQPPCRRDHRSWGGGAEPIWPLPSWAVAGRCKQCIWLFDTSSLLSGGWEVQTMYFYKLLLILTVVLTFINYNQLLNITINLFWLYDSTCILSRTQNSTPSSGRQLLVTKQVWNSRNLKYSQFIDQIKVTSQWAIWYAAFK